MRFGSVGLYLQGSLLHPRYDFQAVGQHGSPFEMLKFLWCFGACLSHWTWRRWFSCFSVYVICYALEFERETSFWGKAEDKGYSHFEPIFLVLVDYADLTMTWWWIVLCVFSNLPRYFLLLINIVFWYQHINSRIFLGLSYESCSPCKWSVGRWSIFRYSHWSCCSLLIIYICMYVYTDISSNMHTIPIISYDIHMSW